MRTLMLFTTLFLASLMAEVKHQFIDISMVNSDLPIVDIRTTGEWKQTGLVKGSIPIMFFNERGEYDVQAFLQELDAKVDTKKPFALICRTGSRTQMVAKFLSDNFGYTVINLKGGVIHGIAEKIPFEPYKQ